jgi:alcohol dehydrogenase
LAELPDLLDGIPAKRPLLVYDPGLASTPWPSRVDGYLRRRFGALSTFDGVEPNPRTKTVDREAERARTAGIDLVVAVGGGSVLDAGKALSMLVANEGAAANYEGRNLFSERPVPFVAVPSTCGTGSEVTWVSVLSDSESKRKISIKGDGMFPTLAVVDADLVGTLPPPLIAQTGLDALTHALEAFVSRRANPASDALAADAVRLLLTNLALCFRNAGESRLREAVMRASTLAGMAFGNADVGAVHCLSESLGGLYDHPHGLLNALLLVPVFEYQFTAVHARLDELAARAMFPAADALSLLDAVRSLVEALDLPSFDSLGVSEDSFTEIAEMAVTNNSNASNPREMAASDYETILTAIAH